MARWCQLWGLNGAGNGEPGLSSGPKREAVWREQTRNARRVGPAPLPGHVECAEAVPVGLAARSSGGLVTGGRAVIIYSNPHSLPESILRLKSKLKSKLPFIWRMQYRSIRAESELPLYFHAHPLEWWNQFRDERDVDFVHGVSWAQTKKGASS